MSLFDGELVQLHSAGLILRNALGILVAKALEILPLFVIGLLLRILEQLAPKQRTRYRATELLLETSKFNAIGCKKLCKQRSRCLHNRQSMMTISSKRSEKIKKILAVAVRHGAQKGQNT